MKASSDDPLVVSSIINWPYENYLKGQSLPLRYAYVRDLAGKTGIKARVAFMRAGYETEFISGIALSAIKVENVLRSEGARIVNPVLKNGLAHRKDLIYPLLAANGISVPKSIPNPTIPEVMASVEAGELSFPLIFRIAEGTMGKGMRIVRDEMELRKAHELCEKGAFAPYRRTMAVEFIDSRTNDLFSKTRLYVLGDKIDMFHRVLDRNWICAGMKKDLADSMVESNRAYKVHPDLEDDALKTGKVLGLEVYAVDVVEDGTRRCIVDVNSTPSWHPREAFFPPGHLERWLDHPRRVAEYLRSL